MLSVPRPTKTSILRTGNVNRLPLATSVAPIQPSVSKSPTPHTRVRSERAGRRRQRVALVASL